MKDIVQNKINHIKQLASQSVKTSHWVNQDNGRQVNVNDSLSKSIRNEREAAVFMDELNAAIKVAKSK